MNNIQSWFLGFALGMLLVLVIYKILYHVVWFNFKLIGKKHNLKTIRCKKCRNYFYEYIYETTEFCCNCILLKINKE